MVQIAYIGLGKIGYEIALHIANKLKKDGEPPLLAYNRTISKAQELATQSGQHVTVAHTLQQVAQEANVIFSCLFDDAAVHEIIGGQLIGSGLLQKGTIIVEQATIAPETAAAVAAQATQAGVVYLSCPVMGAPPRARQAMLIPMLSGGTAADRQNVRQHYIEGVFGKTVLDVGDDVGAALRLKLCGNYFVFALIESVAEGLTLGEAAGVGQENVKALLDALFANTPYVDYSQRMVDESYNDQVKFTLDGAQKDTQHILGLADNVHAELPLTKVFQQHLSTLQNQRGNADVAAVVGGKA
ncbi:unnamed protein product [Absidia cylindrospora]